MSLADCQDWPEAGVACFTNAEKKRIIAKCNEIEQAAKQSAEQKTKRKWGERLYYPRKPRENVAEWFANHAAKLRSLERAAE
jgi:hypothetical protein